jgi:acetyltransferase-like isoleucine patch superfamily enzyme
MRNVSIDSSVKISYTSLILGSGNTLSIGPGSLFEGHLVFEREQGEIRIGCNSSIGNSVLACATKIEIGDDVLISWGCNIVDHNSHAIRWAHRQNDVADWRVGRHKKDWTNVVTLPVKIGNKCWIGLNVIILKGVEIGEGTIIGAGSVVTKSLPSWVIAAGNPATIVREIPLDER